MAGFKIKFPGAVQSVAIDDQQWDTLMAEGVTNKIQFEVVQDRRQETRHEHGSVMQMFVGIGVRDPQRFMVRTRNISRHGVGFVHSRPARRGMRCTLAILTRDQKLTHIKATIASSRSRDDGHYDVGVTFDKAVNLANFTSEAPLAKVV